MELKNEFTYESGPDITAAVRGKTIRCVEVPGADVDDYLVIKFEDGSSLELRYDWIYDWELKHV